MNKFDYLEVAGTHRDVGRAIGMKFRDTIQKMVVDRQKRIANYDKYIKKAEPYFKAAKERFPDLVTETIAIAEAAGVGIADYFSINNREISTQNKTDHCTVVVSFGRDGAMVGHNEDWENTSPGALYILKATIRETTFLGLQYKAAIPGVSATMNSRGLVQCINDLNQTAQIGVPKNFLARAVLECKTLDEAETLIRKTKRASGFNHVLVQGEEVRNIEIAGDKIAIEKVEGKPYVHTNHYLAPEMKSLETSHTRSSEERYKRAKEIIKQGMTVSEMQMLLSDMKNRKHPINRRDATLGSFVASPNQKKVYICYGPPDRGKFQEYEF
jgi:hypothetical protein